jgi:hypothetical protein
MVDSIPRMEDGKGPVPFDATVSRGEFMYGRRTVDVVGARYMLVFVSS